MSGKPNQAAGFAAWAAAHSKRDTPAPEAVAAYAAHLAGRSPAPKRFEVTTRTHRITVELDDQYEEPRGFITVAAAVAHSDDYAEYLDLFRADMTDNVTISWWYSEVFRGFPGGVEYKAAVLALARMALDELHAVNALDRDPAGEAVTYFDYAGCEGCLCTPGAVVRSHRPLTIRGRNFVFWIDTLEGAA